jgi:hypothetical protein
MLAPVASGAPVASRRCFARSSTARVEVRLRLEMPVEDRACDACLGGDVLKARGRVPNTREGGRRRGEDLLPTLAAPKPRGHRATVVDQGRTRLRPRPGGAEGLVVRGAHVRDDRGVRDPYREVAKLVGGDGVTKMARTVALALLAGAAAVAAAVGALRSGGVWGSPLSDLVWTLDVTMLLETIVALLLAVVLGTPGCEIGVWGEPAALHHRAAPSRQLGAPPPLRGREHSRRRHGKRRRLDR